MPSRRENLICTQKSHQRHTPTDLTKTGFDALVTQQNVLYTHETRQAVLMCRAPDLVLVLARQQQLALVALVHLQQQPQHLVLKVWSNCRSWQHSCNASNAIMVC